MSKYNEEYYLAIKSYCERYMGVKPLRKTNDRRYSYKKLLPGEPLFFENFNKEEDIADGVKNVMNDVYIDVTLIIENTLREKFKDLNTYGMQLYPAIFIDDEDEWHENYWCMNFYEFIDCIDKEKSTFSDSTIRRLAKNPEHKRLSVERYSLSEKVLDKIPEQERMFFKARGDSDARVFVHEKAVAEFEAINATGIRFIKVADFELGDEYS